MASRHYPRPVPDCGLVLGAGVAWVMRVPPKVIASTMAFGAVVLISALTFELAAEAAESGGLAVVVIGFLAGAVIYTAANVVLALHGARHRKRSGDQQPSEEQQSGSGRRSRSARCSTASQNQWC